MPSVLAVLALVGGLAAAVFAVVRLRGRRGIATPAQRATYDVLHTAGLATEPLRAGLDPVTAAKAVRHLRTLVGATGLALLTGEEVLALDGRGNHHSEQLIIAARKSVESGRSTVLGAAELPCDRVDCSIRGVVIAPLNGAEAAVAAIAEQSPAPGLVQATLETARWVSTQLALHELDSSRARLAQAELRALRAQISPHFIYNALGAIASFVRTDPERARELILEFAEFTRYSFRSHGEFTTLAEELRSIDRYLTLERARFGERLKVRLRIAPEVLPVVLPFLSVQPLVENAVRHGLSRKPGVGTVSIEAVDAGAECIITVEDDGVGMDPAVLLAATPVEKDGQHVGLSNVDDRLRAVFGEGSGLVVETAPDAGTKVSMRVPKFHPTGACVMRILAVDDELPALDELAYLLRADPRVTKVYTAGDATEALRALRDTNVDAVFLDIRMPGLDGMELARVLRRFSRPPAIVFVTAYDNAAADAFDLGAVDYVRKPIQASRLSEALRRVAATLAVPAEARHEEDDHAIPVELAGTTKMLARSAVRWVEAQGDYARLHTADGSHLVRVPLATLAERWSDSGFVRIHRSYLVQLRLIDELRMVNSGYVVVVDGTELPVSRRHTRDLKDRLVRAAKQDWTR